MNRFLIVAACAAGCQTEGEPPAVPIVVHGESGPATVGVYEAGELRFEDGFLAVLRESGRTLALRVGDDEQAFAGNTVATAIEPEAKLQLLVFSDTMPTGEVEMVLGAPARTDVAAITCDWNYQTASYHPRYCYSCTPAIGSHGGLQHTWQVYRTSQNCHKTEQLASWVVCEPCLFD